MVPEKHYDPALLNQIKNANEQYNQIRQIAEAREGIVKPRPLIIILNGPVGSGKSYAMNQILRAYENEFYAVETAKCFWGGFVRPSLDAAFLDVPYEEVKKEYGRDAIITVMESMRARFGESLTAMTYIASNEYKQAIVNQVPFIVSGVGFQAEADNLARFSLFDEAVTIRFTTPFGQDDPTGTYYDSDAKMFRWLGDSRGPVNTNQLHQFRDSEEFLVQWPILKQMLDLRTNAWYDLLNV